MFSASSASGAPFPALVGLSLLLALTSGRRAVAADAGDPPGPDDVATSELATAGAGTTEAERTPPATSELEEIEVIGERPDPRFPSPTPDQDPTAFGTVIRADDFAGERIEAAQLLLQAPGTRLRRTPAGATMMLRGASADQTLVLLDGIRLNAAVGGGLDLRSIPAGLIDEITVLRGNEGGRYGAGALGGVALLSTRPPGERMEGSLSLSGGSFGTYGLDASLMGGNASLQGIAALSLEQSEGDFPALFDPTPAHDSSDVRIERLGNNDSQSAGLLLKGMARLGGIRVHALGQGSLAERGIPGTLYWRDSQRRGERRILAALRAEPAEKGEHSIEGSVELRHDEVAIWGGGSRGVISQPATNEEGRPWQIENAVETSLVAQTAPFSWTFLRIEGRAGGEWLTTPYADSRSRERLAVGVVDELYLGRAITVAPALRYDRIGAFDGLSPKLGISVRPIAALELRANAGRTFRVPSFGELYLEQGPLKSNPELRPERGFAVDGGVLLRGDDLLFQLSAFYARTSDLISYEVVSGGVSKPFNFLDAEVRGGEAEAMVRPLSWLSLSASYSLATTTNLRDDPRYFGKELPYRPAHRLMGRIATRTRDTEAFVEASHQSAQYVNRSNAGELPSQTSARSGAGARVWRDTYAYDVWLSGQVENVFDAQLIDQLGFPQPGRAFYLTLRVVPRGGARIERDS